MRHNFLEPRPTPSLPMTLEKLWVSIAFIGTLALILLMRTVEEKSTALDRRLLLDGDDILPVTRSWKASEEANSQVEEDRNPGLRCTSNSLGEV